MNKKLLLLIGGVVTLAGIALMVMSLGGSGGPGNLRLQIETKPTIMSAAYKVHANKELKSGRYWLAKVMLTNEGPGILDDVRVSYRIPNYVDWTTPRPFPNVLVNQTIVDLFYPRLPARLAEKLTNSTEQVEIKINYTTDGESKEELRQVDFELKGRNELVYTTMDQDEIANVSDMYENTDLIASFVTPNDPVIKHFTQQLQQKVLGGSTAGVVDTQEEVLRFMEGLYQYQLAAGMVYGGTLGLPEQRGNSFSMVQHVRMPREVLTGEAGLCIELSTLFASVALSGGLKPVIFVTQRHAWPGIKMPDGSIIPIEATRIGGAGIGGSKSFEDAVKEGYEEMQTFFAGGDQGIGAAIGLFDIAALQSAGIQPPELPSDANLIARVDETMKKLTSGGSQKKKSQPKKQVARNSGGGQNNSGGGSNNGGGGRQGSNVAVPAGFQPYQHPTGTFSMGYPSGWSARTNPFPQQLPFLAAAFSANPNPSVPGPGAEVYVFDGYNDPYAALDTIAIAIQSVGGYMNAEPAGAINLKGRQYQMFNGETGLPTVTIHWRGYFTNTGNRTIGIVVSAPAGYMDNYNQMLSQIAETFATR
ncbi:MAG: hypothetical protein AAF438_07965 [Pseudomonadota bacterium]